VPLKCRLHAWLAAHYRVPTVDNLQSFGMHIAENRCALCGQDQETINHLFLLCTFTKQVWSYITHRLCLPEIPSDIRTLWTSWRTISINYSCQESWDTIIIAACWTIWIERNRRVFEGKQSLVTEVTHRTLSLASLWVTNLQSRNLFN
jgi:hypothetical protein